VLESCSCEVCPHTTLCDKVCQWPATGQWVSPVPSTNKTDRHDIAEILLKVALSTINQTINPFKTFHIWLLFVTNFIETILWILLIFTCIYAKAKLIFDVSTISFQVNFGQHLNTYLWLTSWNMVHRKEMFIALGSFTMKYFFDHNRMTPIHIYPKVRQCYKSIYSNHMDYTFVIIFLCQIAWYSSYLIVYAFSY
jgi:hypothetical protein